MAVNGHARALQASLRGEVIDRGHPGYDEARSLYNAMIDRRPLVISYPVDTADVAAAVLFGRREGLEIAVRSGGHNGAGFGCVDDGLVIDLSAMRGVDVDADAAYGPRSRRHPPRPGGCRDARARPRGAIRDHLHHGRRGSHARRRGRSSDADARTLDRQPARGRGRPRGRFASSEPPRTRTTISSGRFAAAAGTSASSRRSRSGCTRSARWSPARCSGRSSSPPEILALVRRVHARAAGRAQWLLRVPLRAARGSPFPAELHLQKVCAVVWCYAGSDEAEADAPARSREESWPAAPGRRRPRCRCPAIQTRVRRRSTRRVTSGTGAPTTSRDMPDAAIEANVEFGVADADAGSRRCTCTRSTALPAVSRPTRPPGRTAT